ncbi:MAG: hypothetical protein HC769_28020 [Cyanobacteria bacterium CRU_2_1]|nr:hypothetical protein [Cyanobacteria bacterium RU_5_0]NJR62327.1 hypothetical protein [Cyanobacteria bacterium CRU_2_1]
MKRPKFSCVFALGAFASTLLFAGFLTPANAQETVISIGSVVMGTLESGDQQLAVDNTFIDVYSFEGSAGQQIAITMTSPDLDSYLVLFDPSGNSLIQDDDGGGNLDARIIYTLPTDGIYTIYANSYSSGQAGTYSLDLQVVTPSSPAIVTTPTQTRYFCDESGAVPVTRARRKDGVEGLLIEWTDDISSISDLSLVERCRRVASSLEAIHTRLGRNFAITTGTLQNQPVVCAALEPGICDPEGRILTASDRDEARRLAIQIGTAINNLQRVPSVSQPPIGEPLAIAPQFSFLDALSYSNCLEDVIQLHQNPQRLQDQGRRSECLPEIFTQYSNGISQAQAVEIIAAADRYATQELNVTILYPPRGQRVRIQELFGYTYMIDQQ